MSAPIEVIIVNYHTEDLLRELLLLLLEEPLIDRIIVVDNSASLTASIPGLEIISPGENLGFSRAVNLGAQKARAPYLLVLNPDVRPLAGSIRALWEAAEESGAALCGPRFFWDLERRWRLPPAEGEALFWALGKRLAESLPPEAIVLSHYWRIRQEHFWAQDWPFKEVFLSGAALLINRKILSPPIFDPRFFLYYEDTDLSLRAEIEGILQLCVPRAEMIHFWNQSPDPPTGKERLFQESRKKLFEKYELFGLHQRLEAALKKEKPFKGLLTKTLKLIRKSPSKLLSDFKPLKNPAALVPKAGEVLELALNPLFIPYAQAGPFPEGGLPQGIFDPLPLGRFFLRLVDKYGRIREKFTFEKKSPQKFSWGG